MSSQPTQNDNIINNRDNIYVIENNEYRILTKDVVKKYITAVCQQAGLLHLDIDRVSKNVFPKLKNVNTLQEIENQIIASTTEMVTEHFDYPKIATWMLISNLHEKTETDYLAVCKKLYNNINKKGNHAPIIHKEFLDYVEKHITEINSAFDYSRDYGISLFGYRTLEKAYLKRSPNGQIIERPQHMYMRVAIAIHYRSDRLDLVLETYELLSKGYFTHATPTLYNAGTTHEQLSSCFLMGVDDDMEEIGECLKNTLVISKFAGGIGIHITNIRVGGAYINSTQGKASGLRVLKIFNEGARYADQGGKRAGSFAFFIEPWHGDIFFFLDLKKNTGAETDRARDLFLGLMINDIFMERVEQDGIWSLMCPSDCPDLLNKYGDEFTRIYQAYEAGGKYLKQIPARELYFKIMEAQIETGVPYIIFKDAVNRKSNQINIGVVNGSNLCCEILEVSDNNKYSVCNLASICLPKFVKFIDGKPSFDYQELSKIAAISCRNLNNIIDINYYPVDRTKFTNFNYRPIGIGVQGLADVFALYRTPFDSELARDLNKKIFETIYHGSLSESLLLAKESGPYEAFQGSPFSQGKFQFDLWGIQSSELSGMWDWDSLRNEMIIHGVKNSLITTCMPTASTSQIQNNNETIEPYTENIYTRSTLAGEFDVINPHLMKHLMELGLWNSDMVDLIKYYDGSIQQISGIPQEIKDIHRTVWEINQKSLIEMCADRGPFIDQTQSFNIFIDKPSFPKLNSCLFYGWKKGLKTGMYYLRSKAASKATQFGIDINKIKEIEKRTEESKIKCVFRPKHLRSTDSCDLCSS